MQIQELLRAKREDILNIASKHGARNIRIFGSVARGEADSESDLDLLVEFLPGSTLLSQSAMIRDNEIPTISRTRPLKDAPIFDFWLSMPAEEALTEDKCENPSSKIASKSNTTC